MIKLFLKITIRNILKNGAYSIVNILGLALGLAAFLYITTYVLYETNYDSFHSKADRTYRCVTKARLGETSQNFIISEAPLAETLARELPEVETATRLYRIPNIFTKYIDKEFNEENIYYADANVFDVFDFKIIEGDKMSALSQPNSILLSQKVAEKYFGEENPIGKSITLAESIYLVTGVLENIQGNSHLQFDFLASFSTLDLSKDNQWWNFQNIYTYIVAKEGVDINLLEQKYIASARKYEEVLVKNAFGTTLADFEAGGNFTKRKLQPLRDIHLSSTFPQEGKSKGSKSFLIVLGITGILILIIACCNFINLSTARASFRAKEIGVKQIVGSSKIKIGMQAFSETLIYCILALIISFVFLIIFLPLLNRYSEIIISPYFFLNKMVLITIVSTPIVTAILAGTYPAFFITNFKLTDVVKGRLFTNNKSPWLRNGLVSFQFVVFIVLIFTTVVVSKQINLLRIQNPGFDKENVLVVKNMNYLGKQRKSFKETLLNNPSVLSASFSSDVPSADAFEKHAYWKKGENKKHLLNELIVDNDFLKTLNVKMQEGRFFSDNLKSEKTNVIINEKTAKLLGWSNSNGKVLYNNDNHKGKDLNVIGIVKNFHMESMKEDIQPYLIKLTDRSNFLSIRLHPGNISETLKGIEGKWDIFNRDESFEYFFLDKSFDAQYKSEERLSKIISVFTMIAIFIACLGLFGLVSYTATQKTKEIGIRKVNGAKISEILLMLNKDFLKWVAIAFVVACPIAYYAMNKWLESFAYKTNLSWWIFALAGVLALGIALLTVSWQSWRAATRNPVEALRYE